MKQVTFFFLLLSVFSLQAQSLEVGHKLSFEVDFQGDKYECSVKPTAMGEHLEFDFMLTAGYGIFSRVDLTPKAQKSAKVLVNEFMPENPFLTFKDATTVFPSEPMTDALNNNKKIELDAGRGFKSFAMGATKSLEITLQNGNNSSSKQISATELVSADGKEHIWISRDLGKPIIVEMDLGWTIRLKTWTTAYLPMTDQPASLLGLHVGDPKAKVLMQRLAASSSVSVEDLSDAKGPYVIKEYFCPMEGIRVETFNDTLKKILFYTEGFDHEGFKWRGYAGIFGFGLKLGMTYEQVDAALGKPTDPRWPTDVLIQYPQQRLTVYYDMPENDNDTPAIRNAKINFIEFE